MAIPEFIVHSEIGVEKIIEIYGTRINPGPLTGLGESFTSQI
jgi:hypothetical protein